MKQFTPYKQGFTLIEMLVSVAIFSVVMVMALGALLSLSVANRKAQSLKSSIDNLNFALDAMSRTIRTGNNYHCGSPGGGDCSPVGSNIFYFTSNTGHVIGYELDTVAGDCGQTGSTVGCLARSTDGGSWIAITSPDVVINDLSGSGAYLFYVLGSPPASTPDTKQPVVVLTLSGFAQVSTTQQAAFHLQTVITERLYDQ